MKTPLSLRVLQILILIIIIAITSQFLEVSIQLAQLIP